MRNTFTILLVTALLCYANTLIAQTATAPAGNGTAANPYRIESLENLYWVSQNTAQWVAGKYFIQTANINASATNTWYSDGSGGYYGFPGIGSEDNFNGQLYGIFRGNYDGQGYAISNLYIRRPKDRIGLFGYANTATVRNLNISNCTLIITATTEPYGAGILFGYSTGCTVDNVHISGGSITSNSATGGFASAAPLSGWVDAITISNCTSSANVTTNSSYCGGFVGIKGSGVASFTNCHASGSVTSSAGGRIGGFIGQTDNSGTSTFTNCSASGNVSATSIVGGFTGYFASTSATLNNCFSRGNVTATSGLAGGFYAYTSSTTVVLNYCYSTGLVTASTKGGFGNQASGTITHNNCFWNTQTSGLANALPSSTPAGITGKTTAEMKTASTFTNAGWDYVNETTNGTNDHWFISVTENNGYPSLAGNIREWTGAISSNWSDADNWKNSILPSASSIIKINTSAVNLPAVSSLITVDRFSFNGVDHILDLGNYNLVCNQVLGFGANKYVKTSGSGVLKMNISNTRLSVFPVGLSAYNPVSIYNNSGSSDAFSVFVLDELYVNGSNGTASNASRLKRTWNISKTNPNGGSGVNFTFNWNSGETVNLITPALYHFESGNWSRQTGTTSSTSNSLTYTGYTGTFSPFAVGDNTSTLPVSWLSFTAREENGHSIVKWETSSEINSKQFFVQHSTDQSAWKTIGIVAAAGNSISTQSYTYLHTTPAIGVNYYRLLQQDIDGRVNYSKVLVLNSYAHKAIALYPNPVSNGSVTIELEAHSIINMYNAAGELLLQKRLPAGKTSLDVSRFAKGMYTIKGGNYKSSFIVQ